MSVVVVDELGELMNYIPAWEDLAACAVEPNVFYEPWFLIPALKAFASGKQIKFVLIFSKDPARPLGPDILCGFFPLELQNRYRGLPVSVLSLWRHIHCYLCTPLLRTGYARESVAVFLGWLSETNHSRLIEFSWISGDGPVYKLLVDYFHERSTLTCITECMTRALFRPAADVEQYMRETLSGRHRKTLRRRESALSTGGKLEYSTLDAAGDIEFWTNDFLKLEASGWKGQEGSALSCDKAAEQFFSAVAKSAFHRRQLLMLALRFNDRPIAYRFSLLAKPGSFSFKIAFDEEFGRYSPGALLHLENIRQLHSRSGIEWMDSCTRPNNSMLNRLWPGRRTILSLVFSAGRSPGDLVVALIPLIKWMKRKRTVPELVTQSRQSKSAV